MLNDWSKISKITEKMLRPTDEINYDHLWTSSTDFDDDDEDEVALRHDRQVLYFFKSN
jgi:hypothetical protein